MSDEEYGRLQEALMEFPLLGQLIPHSGGLRKLRWGLRGRGKRGGARVIYYFVSEAGQFLMISAYAKSSKKDLTPAELTKIRKVMEAMLDE